MNPIWIERTSNGELMTDVFAKLIKERTIFLTGEITRELASTIVATLFLLNNEDKEKEITLWIYSEGGDVGGFFAIYDVMQLIEAPVRTICFGEASSAAAMVLAGGTKGMRHCLPNAYIMIHQIQAEMFGGGTGTEIEIEAKEIKKLKKRLTQILARHTGQFESKVARDCEHDKYMNAEAALEYGLIDSIKLPIKSIPDLKTKAKRSKSLKKAVVDKKLEEII